MNTVLVLIVAVLLVPQTAYFVSILARRRRTAGTPDRPLMERVAARVAAAFAPTLAEVAGEGPPDEGVLRIKLEEFAEDAIAGYARAAAPHPDEPGLAWTTSRSRWCGRTRRRRNPDPPRRTTAMPFRPRPNAALHDCAAASAAYLVNLLPALAALDKREAYARLHLHFQAALAAYRHETRQPRRRVPKPSRN